MATLQLLHKVSGATGGTPVIGANSVTFSQGDPVLISATGFLELATAGSKIHGWCLEDSVMASDNQTVAKVTPLYLNERNVRMIMESDIDCTQTDVGAYADIKGTTSGAFQVDLLAGATGSLLVEAFDPYGTSTNTQVVVCVAETSLHSIV